MYCYNECFFEKFRQGNLSYEVVRVDSGCRWSGDEQVSLSLASLAAILQVIFIRRTTLKKNTYTLLFRLGAVLH